jgi:hypothetical protein
LWQIDDDEPDVDQWRDALALIRESLELDRSRDAYLAANQDSTPTTLERTQEDTTRADIELLCLEVEDALEELEAERAESEAGGCCD